jgi:hypothetical protein
MGKQGTPGQEHRTGNVSHRSRIPARRSRSGTATCRPDRSGGQHQCQQTDIDRSSGKRDCGNLRGPWPSGRGELTGNPCGLNRSVQHL